MATSVDRRIRKLMKTPPVHWAAIADADKKTKNNFVDTNQMCRFLDNDAERAAMLAEYFRRRTDGDDHPTAAKKANAVLLKVRRALGYTMPKAGLVQF